MVAGREAALGRCHAGQTVTVMVSGTTLAIKFNDGEAWVIRRTTPPGPCYEMGQLAWSGGLGR